MAIIQTAGFNYFETALKDPRHVTVTTAEQLREMVARVRSAPVRAMDTETSGLRWDRGARIVGLAYAVPDPAVELRTYYLPFRHLTGEAQLPVEVALDAAQDIARQKEILTLFWHKKFDDHMLRADGIHIRGGTNVDVMIAAGLYNENAPLALKERAVIDLGDEQARVYEKEISLETARLARRAGLGKTAYKDRYGYSQIPIHLAGTYAGYDVRYTHDLWKFYSEANVPAFYSQLQPRCELSLWEIEQELTEVLCDVEEVGLPLDAAYLHALGQTTLQAVEGLEHAIWDELGHHRKCNLDSDDELRFLLERHLGFELTKPTRGGQMSVDREVLTEIALAAPVVLKILDRREAKKIATTYTESLIERTDPLGLLHCDFRQLGASSGRLSCANPNLQNVVGDSDDRAKSATGKRLEDGGRDPWSVRRAFRMHPGRRRWYFDLSQIELRALAYFSRDPALLDAYQKGEDIHNRTSMLVFGDVAKEHRTQSKVANFGTAYGLTPKGFSRRLGKSLEEGQAFYDKFYAAYPGIRTLQHRLWATMRSRQGCWFVNPWGRNCRIKELVDSDKWVRLRAERQAIAKLIQGTAAEVTKEGMVRCHRELRRQGLQTRMVLTIHDDLQFDGPPEEESIVVPLVLREFTRVPQFAPVPVTADAQYSDADWSSKFPVPGVGGKA